MTIKEQINQELEKLPEPLLQELLDFVQFLQIKHQSVNISVNNQLSQSLIAEHTFTNSTAEDLLEFVGSWEGSDITECLQIVHESRISL
jgi:sulfur carrier protein ThiS